MRYLLFPLFFCLLGSCSDTTSNAGDERLNVVTTTTMLTDLAKNIGGDSIRVTGLMGSGVDPHLYKASEGDVTKLTGADVIFYNGLHLEGKLEDVFERMGRDGKTVALAEVLDKSGLISSANFASNYDPHVWFDIEYWFQMAEKMTTELIARDPENADFFRERLRLYLVELTELEADIRATIATLPENRRVLVTAHDAFNYFGRAYGFEVVGLQGLSTATEAGVRDVQELADLIIERQIPAIFVESSVPRRTIEALQAAVRSRDFTVEIGGTLYSDALGSAGTEEGTYTGMFRANVSTIVTALQP